MKSRFAVLVAVVFCAGALGLARAAEEAKADLVASKEGKKYHLASCAVVKNIKADNKVAFKSAQEAFEAGYEPCGTCKPPVETKVVASKESDKYHFPSCKAAAKIKKDNLVEYKSSEEAAKDKKTPCGTCKPPEPAKDDTKKDDAKK